MSANKDATSFHSLVLTQAQKHLLHTSIHYPQWEMEEAEKSRQWSEWESWNKSYQSMQIPHEGEGSVISLDSQEMAVTITEISYDETLAKLAEKGNLSWFCDFYDYDEVLFDESATLGGHTRYKLCRYLRPTGEFVALVDKLSFQDDALDVKGDVTLALMQCHQNESVGAILLDNMVPSLSIEVDGQPANRDGDLVLIPPGSHSLTLRANGYQSRESQVEVPSDGIIHVDASLERIQVPTLSLVSNQGVVSWFADGVFQGSSSSLQLNNPELPLLVAATKDGFVTQTHQFLRSQDLVTFNLARDWTRNPKFTQDVSRQFYSSFISLILSVGLTLAYPTLYNVYGEGNYLTGGIYVASQGLAVMSGMSLFFSLCHYSVTTMRQ